MCIKYYNEHDIGYRVCIYKLSSNVISARLECSVGVPVYMERGQTKLNEMLDSFEIE